MHLFRRRGAVEIVLAFPRPFATGAILFGITAAIGSLTIPRQLAELSAQINGADSIAQALHFGKMQRGLVRLIVVDRIVPPITPLLAAIILLLLSGPALSLSQDREKILSAAVLLGLTPILLQRAGELVVTYLTSAGHVQNVGEAVLIPHHFETGVSLLVPYDWAWLEPLSARLNLFSLWCVVLWSGTLSQLDSGRAKRWHYGLPVACLAVAGLVTWILGPAFARGILTGW